MSLRLDCGVCIVRSWTNADLPALVKHADDRTIWLNLRDRFPHPYTESHARAFIRSSIEAPVETAFAIDVNGEAVGAIGVVPGTDVERVGAEVGYWVSRHFQGRGIATAALRAVTDWAFDAFALTRLFAIPFLRNEASCRVLEKAGYTREGILRRSALKEGIILDQAMYAIVRDAQPGS